MVNFATATSAEQPINRDGAVPTFGADEEGVLVGMDENGELVEADAASGTAIPAVGLTMSPVFDPASASSWPSEVKAQVQAESNVVKGEHKLTFVHYGIEVVDEDGEGSLTPGQPVYLATGGGFTQTAPSTAGDIVQQLGIAGADGDTILLDVDWNHTTA